MSKKNQLEAQLITDAFQLGDSASIKQRLHNICELELISKGLCKKIKANKLSYNQQLGVILSRDTIQVGISHVDNVTGASFFVAQLYEHNNEIYSTGKIIRPQYSMNHRIKVWENYRLPNMWEYEVNNKIYNLTLLPLYDDSTHCLFIVQRTE